MERSLSLKLMPGRYVVARLSGDAPIPDVLQGELVSITRTRDELSIVCGDGSVLPGARRDDGWRCVRLDGVWAFHETGVLASITTPLAAAEIGIFALATFDTDYVLVKEEFIEEAVRVLKAANHRVET